MTCFAHDEQADLYIAKARESLAGAESEFANGRHNNCANRAYYAAFHGAVAALAAHGLVARGGAGRSTWSHEALQAAVVGELISRRKAYPTGLRDVLLRTQALRNVADYEEQLVTELQAARALRHARRLVGIVEEQSLDMFAEAFATLEPRRRQPVRDLVQLIQTRFPSATFRLRSGVDDPDATYLIATVDIDDPDDVLDLVVERLLTLQVDEGLPIYVLPVHTPARVAATRQRALRTTHLEAMLPTALS